MAIKTARLNDDPRAPLRGEARAGSQWQVVRAGERLSIVPVDGELPNR